MADHGLQTVKMPRESTAGRLIAMNRLFAKGFIPDQAERVISTFHPGLPDK
ncbi:hypothetical protein [Allorhizobium sonneratiae]|uniref:hypothetical protein n=1 Tax=Allorhizobium sonneratiae TaxID=2934936 RepID=UPI0020339B9C|nr:hypothetical protein [Allorhizobium sonneratiae]